MELNKGITKPTIRAYKTANSLGIDEIYISISDENSCLLMLAKVGTDRMKPIKTDGSTNITP